MVSVSAIRVGALALLSSVTLVACGASTQPRASRARSPSTPPVAVPAPSTRIVAQPLRAAAAGLRPGTGVSPRFLGVRVFANRRDGFAITDLPQAGDGTYPVSTTDGGQTWRTDGPVLHIPAAQGPSAVDQAGVAGARTYFAWCGACNLIIDITADAGEHWWRAVMPGQVLAVIGSADPRAGLTAIIAGPTPAASGRGASLWVYTSPDGLRWTYDHEIDAVS